MKTSRKSFLGALGHIKSMVPRYSPRVMFRCVRLEARDGKLTMQGVDLENQLSISIPADGDLDPCVVEVDKLVTRVKAGKSSEYNLEVRRDDEGGGYSLIVSGGRVSHSVPGESLEEWSPGEFSRDKIGEVQISGQELRKFLPTAMAAMAKDQVRQYSVQGVLLELKEHQRLVGTDGHRMVIIDLETAQTKASSIRAILPEMTCNLVCKLIDKRCDEIIRINIHKSNHVEIVGNSWVLKSTCIEGNFPQYESVIPDEEINDWEVKTSAFKEVLSEVAVSVKHVDRKRMVLKFDQNKVVLRAGVAWDGVSEGEVSARYLCGNEDKIVVACNPDFIKDAVNLVDSNLVKFRLVQNRVRKTGDVVSHPVQIIGNQVHWVVMHCELGSEVSPETVGQKNYDEFIQSQELVENGTAT